jgi:microcin C transport system substrate-binding protein
VPQWYANTHRLAYWDVFGHPANLPKYLGAGAPDLWWSAAKSSPTGEAAK